MKTLRASLICSAYLHAATAVAEPCVGEGFDQPFPGATDVAVLHLDIPSSQFPGMWQEGRIDGVSFRLFANGDGDIRSDERDEQRWQISIICSSELDDCTELVEGTPPDVAARIVSDLQSCIRGEKFAPPDTLPDAHEPEVVEQMVLESPCKLALLSDDSDEIALQKLLAMAGADPGPADGLIGPQTLDAFSQVTGESARAFELSSAVSTLKMLVCDP